ncbi:MAG: peroxiredoxin [Candidatus Nomurabacteria bacterium]|nr:MAG: peroxiredoxin [Candidatus Nomurabacteria bacterium]HRV76133.1 peroxiredoxin [Candidatus Saccharimonadales bacterium]
MSEESKKAPDFKLEDQDGNQRSLKDFSGEWLILYFYPKDDTPGCTVEACSLRDANDELISLGANVVGISKDDQDSHLKFKAKYKLNFTLLSDPSGKTIEAYGAWGPKMFGKVGILRKTFIISPEGKIVRTYGRVTPLGHGEQVIAELKSQIETYNK